MSNWRRSSPTTTNSTPATTAVLKMMSAPSAFSELMEEWGTENPRETPTTTEKTATATSSLTKNLRRGTGPSGRPPSPHPTIRD